ncbi:MAG TPA: MgtC/SapB family protein [Anaerolineae bacterium]|nr:MgtC/SapB family protein [Anaerolineae bacterium]
MSLNTIPFDIDVQMFLRLLIAVVLGALVGYERERGRVHGLTTAASLWVTAAIGLAVGVGMVLMSVATAVLVFVLLRFGPRPRLKASPEEGE